MFVIKRNQVVVTALAVMIAAAGYLNFQESRSSEGKQTALQLTEEGDVTAWWIIPLCRMIRTKRSWIRLRRKPQATVRRFMFRQNGNDSAYFAEANAEPRAVSRRRKSI